MLQGETLTHNESMYWMLPGETLTYGKATIDNMKTKFEEMLNHEEIQWPITWLQNHDYDEETPIHTEDDYDADDEIPGKKWRLK